jgi:hypothetical protein
MPSELVYDSAAFVLPNGRARARIQKSEAGSHGKVFLPWVLDWNNKSPRHKNRTVAAIR